MVKIRAGITAGDINGIGIELILKTFNDQDNLDRCTPIVYADIDVMQYHMHALALHGVSLNVIDVEEDAKEGVINVFSSWGEPVNFDLGKSSPAGGKYALESLERACGAIEKRLIDIMVTAPLNKNNIEHRGFTGHTGFLADKFGSGALMIMVSESIKVALATGHIPVAEVARELTENLVFEKIIALHKSLIEDFGIAEPAIAVLGLNPHAGDGGLIGREEIELIAPAIARAKELGIDTKGPISADGFFGARSYKQYDGVLAMYHDQGLIPFKAISFDSGVNFTAGLSIVRTSPGHGVAYDLTGQGSASANSLTASLHLACDTFQRRCKREDLPLS
ncbi:MAG: 4-hydroxythreonine-4-phosphate dehydrogenase PdxA [Flavobacteriales bacterium]|nr:4-hydroxythreonine-4-phosphate dehydrogenase PdxA [Flavobacteriales bacterium]